MRKFRKKLIPSHQALVNKYLYSRYNPCGLYKRARFCKDENIVFVRKIVDYDEDGFSLWGCVNMAHQLLMQFKYEWIFNYGHFLIGKGCNGYDLYNKKGKKLYEIGGVRRTPHKAYRLILDVYRDSFRIAIRKMSISKGLYSRFYVLDNGLAFVQNKKGKVGLILFTKLKLPFEYYSIAIPQNGYTLGVIESCKEKDTVLYDCRLIKVRNQIKLEDSIHPTGINLFTRKTLEEVNAYFENKDKVEADCNAIICYNQNVCIYGKDLKFFPYDTSNVGEKEEEEDSNEREDDYNVWEHYSYEEAMYDALGGEMDAIWNID